MSNNKYKVLIVEDEANICSFIETLLTTNDYQALVAHTCTMGLTLFASHNPDLVILDLGLPDMDGMEVLKSVRKWSNLPVVVVSARNHEHDKVEALDYGADDYLVKPFALRELEARIRALLRRGRAQENAQGGELRVDDVCIDVAGHRVTRQGREVRVSPTGFRILCELARRAPALVRREELERRLWGDDLPGGSALRTHIHELRQHLDKPFGSPVLHTISHVGYRLGREEEPEA